MAIHKYEVCGPIVDISNSTNNVAVESEQEPFHVIVRVMEIDTWSFKIRDEMQ